MVSELLTMRDTIDVLEKAYIDLVAKEAVCRPRIDIQIPTSDPKKAYQWGSMEGGSVGGYFAIRMKSDVVYEQEYNGVRTIEKYCTKPGLFCGLIFVTDVETGEPLAFVNDGVLQHMRVGADSGIGVKYLSREDSGVVGMIGSGGMARTHLDAFMCVRNIKLVKVFSPTKANREAYAVEMSAKYDIEVIAYNDPEDVYKGADIISGCTDSAVPVLISELFEPGQHIVNVGGAGGLLEQAVQDRIDIYFRFGNAPAPQGLPELNLPDSYVTYAARPDHDYGFKNRQKSERGRGIAIPERVIYFEDIRGDPNRGRTSRHQITYSERGNLQGNQFHAVAGRTYELAKEAGIGNEVPTEWFLQDIRD